MPDSPPAEYHFLTWFFKFAIRAYFRYFYFKKTSYINDDLFDEKSTLVHQFLPNFSHRCALLSPLTRIILVNKIIESAWFIGVSHRSNIIPKFNPKQYIGG